MLSMEAWERQSLVVASGQMSQFAIEKDHGSIGKPYENHRKMEVYHSYSGFSH
jgi:hypothetical protein